MLCLEKGPAAPALSVGLPVSRVRKRGGRRFQSSRSSLNTGRSLESGFETSLKSEIAVREEGQEE